MALLSVFDTLMSAILAEPPNSRNAAGRRARPNGKPLIQKRDGRTYACNRRSDAALSSESHAPFAAIQRSTVIILTMTARWMSSGCAGSIIASCTGSRPPMASRTCEPRIVVDGCIVRIITEPDARLTVPKRQSFAWPANAEAYAQQLSLERGWKLERAEP